jgi:hypothetical protein
LTYYQVDNYNKRLIQASIIGSEYDFDSTKTNYELNISYRALNYIELVLNFAFTVEIFIILFSFVGFFMVLANFLAWLVNRLTTHLLNPPDLKIWSLLALTAPPPAAGVILAVIPIWIFLQIGNSLIYGEFYYDPANPRGAVPLGTALMEVANNGSAFNLVYGNLLNTVQPAELALARSGRTGTDRYFYV